MNKKLILLGIIFASLAAIGWTTNKSSGTKHDFAIVTAAGAAIGTGVSIPQGWSFISIVNTATGMDSILIVSPDVANSNGQDTLYIPAGGSYSGNFPHDVDSLYVFNVSSGKVFIEVSN